MGVCVFLEGFGEFNFNSDYTKVQEERALKEKQHLVKYIVNQRIITVNKFQ